MVTNCHIGTPTAARAVYIRFQAAYKSNNLIEIGQIVRGRRSVCRWILSAICQISRHLKLEIASTIPAFTMTTLNYFYLTLSSLNLFYHCHLHALQAGNCCRNFRLVVDEDDLMWVKN